MTNINNITVNAEINVNAFVVPNMAPKVSDFMLEHYKDYIKMVGELNGVEVTEDDFAVELWMHNKEELASDNLNDHGFAIPINDEFHIRVNAPYMNWIPLKLLKGVKEGDTITYKTLLDKAGAIVAKNGSLKARIDDCVNVELTIHLKCEQQGYRYRRFGNFEVAVAYVTPYEMKTV